MSHNKQTIRLLWLLPITQQEHTFLKTHDVECLEQLFDQHEINYLVINRKSVVA